MTLCNHLWSVVDVSPLSVGCDECDSAGMQWVDLRICMTCGYVGCCNKSLGKHASAHWILNPGHPIIRSFEPGEDWWWCFSDRFRFDVKGAPPAPSHDIADGPQRDRPSRGRMPILPEAAKAERVAQNGTESCATSAMVRALACANGVWAGIRRGWPKRQKAASLAASAPRLEAVTNSEADSD